MPGEPRTKKGQHENTKGIYHFLLGDPGMSKYTDKVIKELETENIKKIKVWNKEFTSKFNDDDIQTVLRLSETIDTLWDKVVELRKKVKVKTEDKLSVYGHEDTIEGSHLTIREKDALLHKVYMSEGGENASPYARLKAAMDYWCALWFWPIDRADLLPSRQEFFFDMSLILEGGIAAVTTSSSGQMSFLDSAGKVSMDEMGNLKLSTDGTQLALEIRNQYSDLGIVCLDDLRSRSERLAIANQIAKEQKFQHWELEFADVFKENGGFDLMIGNPPWLKMTWKEEGILSDKNPIFAVKKMSANEISKARMDVLKKDKISYLNEFESMAGIQNYLNASQNYICLKGQQTNLWIHWSTSLQKWTKKGYKYLL